MTRTTAFLSEQEVIAAVDRLDGARLARFVRTRMILPVGSAGGHAAYRQVDIARLELLCDLCDDFELDDDALGIIMGLIDQLHGTRSDLGALMSALAQESEEVRERVKARLED